MNRHRTLLRRASILVGLLGIVILTFAMSNAKTWRLTERAVKWRTTVNTSADTGYVIDANNDTTGIQQLFVGDTDPAGNGVVRGLFMPDSIFVRFKATDMAAGTADSALFTVDVQSYDPTTGLYATRVNVAAIKQPNTSDPRIFGFTWQPRTVLTNTDGRVVSSHYRYVFDGAGTAGMTDDSTKITNVTETLVVIE